MRAQFEGWRPFLLLAAPGVLLGVTGMTHPHRLDPSSAEHWFWMHVAGVFIFPLVGAALAWLVRGRRDPVAVAIMLTAFVYAILYTALDVVSGIGNGYTTWQLGEEAVPRPRAISLAFQIGTRMGDIGAWALFACAVLVTLDVLRRRGLHVVTVVPALLLLGGSWLIREEHIFWPGGAISCIAVGVATGMLGAIRPAGETAETSGPRAPRDTRTTPVSGG
ncbi:MAG: hypothetical protein WA892_02510 [Ornithinimicrobium sp.]